jgi:hypothetical protein
MRGPPMRRGLRCRNRLRRLQLQLLHLMGRLPTLLGLARVPIALTDAVRHRLTKPGGPRFVCGAICMVRGLRIAAGRQSTRSSDAGSPPAAARVSTIFLQSGDDGIQWRL